MRILRFDVNGTLLQKDKKCNFNDIQRGSNNYLELVFNFNSDWIGKAKVAEVRDVSGNKRVYTVMNNTCVLTDDVTKESLFSVKLYGKNGETKIQTNKVYVSQE